MNLKKMRINSGLKANYIANKLGVTRQAYYNYEKRKRKPKYLTIEKLAKLFNVTYEDIEKCLEE